MSKSEAGKGFEGKKMYGTAFTVKNWDGTVLPKE
jgi:hypothetical protein